MTLDKPANPDHEVHPLIRDRWSPRAFAERPVGDEALASLFEAARWAASCGNEQPWSFVYAHRADAAGFEAIFDCLKSGNQTWAHRAGVLAVSVAKLDFVHPDKPDRPNRYALHDVGLATAQLMLQATAMGLVVHAMAGFDRDEARTALSIPEGHEAVAALAIGYQGASDELPEKLREREHAPRTRREQVEFVFRDSWRAP
jgi:nitroreductase